MARDNTPTIVCKFRAGEVLETCLILAVEIICVVWAHGFVSVLIKLLEDKGLNHFIAPKTASIA